MKDVVKIIVFFAGCGFITLINPVLGVIGAILLGCLHVSNTIKRKQ